MRLEAGNRKQETEDRTLEAGDRRQEIGDRRQETGGDRHFFPNVFLVFVKQSIIPRSVDDFIATFHKGFIKENLFISIFE